MSGSPAQGVRHALVPPRDRGPPTVFNVSNLASDCPLLLRRAMRNRILAQFILIPLFRARDANGSGVAARDAGFVHFVRA